MSGFQQVFVSSSLDLKLGRKLIEVLLEREFQEYDWDDQLKTYLWERDTKRGALLNDRFPPQRMLQDPASGDVVLTLALFGERCGIPLENDLPEHMAARIADWRAEPGKPGVLHPWPETGDAQKEALAAGCYPLTGTTYELISADQHPDGHALVLGYVANRDIRDAADVGDIIFNGRQQRNWLEEQGCTDNEVRALYEPQIRALFNLLKHLVSRGMQPHHFASEKEMAHEVSARAVELLVKKLNYAIRGNPFKSRLGHYALDDRRNLPGRRRLVAKCATKIRAIRQMGLSSFVMIKGPSGCGKSSVLQAGVLKVLRDDGDIVLAVRPTDLQPDYGNQTTRLDLLWQRLESEIVGLTDPSVISVPQRDRAGLMSRRLARTLEAASKRLVIGLDQFEEMIDEMFEFRDKRDRPEGWWQVLQFLKQALKSPNVELVTTLESLREERFMELGIAKYLESEQVTYNAEVTADALLEIVVSAFKRAGLELADDLQEELKRYWDAFRKEQAEQGITSSPLPLAGLWFERLYTRFEHLADISLDDEAGARDALNRAAREKQNLISLRDFPDGVSFSRLIAALAEDAWDLGSGSRYPADDPKYPGKPTYISLTNFLSGLVGMDGGRMQLLTAPAKCGDPGTDRLIEAFLQKRLLVFADENLQLVRLTHQAVIDHWPVAKAWAEKRQEYFAFETSMRKFAAYWASEDFSEEIIEMQATPARIQQAAQILGQYRVAWPAVADNDLPAEDALLRRTVIALFSQAKDPREIVQIERKESCYFHVAIQHGIAGFLRHHLSEDPDLLELRGGSERLPLAIASWQENGAVPILIEFGATLPEASDKDHPLAISCWTNSVENLKALMPMQDVEGTIFDGGTSLMHWAVSGGGIEVFDHLLSIGEPIDVKDDALRLPLHTAGIRGSLYMFEKLFSVDGVMSPTSNGFTPFHIAAQQGHMPILSFVESHPDITEEHLKKLYEPEDPWHTPITSAAMFKQPDALYFLLNSKFADLKAEKHAGTSLFDLVMTPVGDVRDDQRQRARQCIEILLADTRLDGSGAQAAFEKGEKFPEARDVLRRVLPTDYAQMDEATRESDLRNRRDSVALKLLRDAPQALTDKHRNRTGLEILTADNRFEILAACVDEGLVPEDDWKTAVPTLLVSACKEGADGLRSALFRATGTKDDFNLRPILLDGAVQHQQMDLVTEIMSDGTNTLYGVGTVAKSYFHDLAEQGETDAFRERADNLGLRCPVDAWGRYPSDVAPDKYQAEFRKLEDELFSDREDRVPSPLVLPTIAEPDKDKGKTPPPAAPAREQTDAERIIVAATRGQARRFEDLLKRLDELPVDSWGRRPSDHAPDRVQSDLAQIEDEYFKADGSKK